MTSARSTSLKTFCLLRAQARVLGLLAISSHESIIQGQSFVCPQKSIFKYQHLVSLSMREEVILRELRAMVDFALWTPLQDERVAGAPLEAVAKLLDDTSTEFDEADAKVEGVMCDRRSWAEAVLSVVAPLLEKAAPPAALARALARLTQQHPRSQLVPMLSSAITRCLKHTVDFGKSPDMRKLLQVGARVLRYLLFILLDRNAMYMDFFVKRNLICRN